jgi:hypothetical protein
MMAIEQAKRMTQIVKVAEVRKQRLANAAADARRNLASAEQARNLAVQRVHQAEVALCDADKSMLQSAAGDQMLIWRVHCAAQRQERLSEKVQFDEVCVDAGIHLSNSVQALQRQDLRHDHLAGKAMQLRQKMARIKEARMDDEGQGSGQQGAPVLR